MEREWLTIQEAADYLGVARPTIYRWAKQGRLPIYKLAEGVSRIKAHDLQGFIEEARPLYGTKQTCVAKPAGKKGSIPHQEDPLLEVIGCLSGESVTAEKIEEEIYEGDTT
ncbi:MAG: helix-turn-helix domain-containing protein [Firmicutes bacterium]|nr:helix-turn-helix domain-containing protein [Bacillota bacterium]